MDGEDRGQSIQIGAIILFGALVVLFSVYQAVVVPQQNVEIESNHLQTVDRQMQDLRNDIVSLPGTGSDRSVTVTLGTTYPARIIAMNPGPPTGALRTDGTQNANVNLTLANAVATDGEVDDFWDGTDRAYNTGRLAYVPNYNEYENAPTFVYENTLLFKDFRSGNLSVSGQRLVDGTRLTLITLNGSYDRASGDSVALDIEAVSASDTTVSITNGTGANVTIRVASRRNASAWREVLDDDEQFTDQGGHVVGVTETALPNSEFDRVDIELEGDVTYTLRMAKAGVGTQVAGETEAYLADVRGDGASIQENSTTDLVVQVRDGFNNPVTGVQVNASIESGTENGTISPTDATTDADGEAVFDYESAGIDDVSSRSFDVNFSFAVHPDSSFDPDTAENVTMNVTVQNTDSSGVSSGGSSGGSSAGDDGALTQASIINVSITDVSDPFGGNSHKVDVTFDNTDAKEYNITAARFVGFYDGSVSCTCPEQLKFNDAAPALGEGEEEKELSSNVTISANSAKQITFTFEDSNGNGAGVGKSDGVFVEVVYRDPNGNRIATTYFFQLGGYNGG